MFPLLALNHFNCHMSKNLGRYFFFYWWEVVCQRSLDLMCYCSPPPPPRPVLYFRFVLSKNKNRNVPCRAGVASLLREPIRRKKDDVRRFAGQSESGHCDADFSKLPRQRLLHPLASRRQVNRIFTWFPLLFIQACLHVVSLKIASVARLSPS